MIFVLAMHQFPHIAPNSFESIFPSISDISDTVEFRSGGVKAMRQIDA